MNPNIKIKRIYEEADPSDGYRVLIDRLWPRGVKKEAAAIDEWEKDLAPTTTLRTWFGHKPELWTDFKKRYIAELRQNPAVETFIEKNKTRKRITLLFGAKDEQHTHAIVLQQYLEQQL